MPKKGSKSKSNRSSYHARGGDAGATDLNDVHLWGQDQSPPGSYKIQLGYLEIPKTIKYEEKWMDTPYRFRSFQDANHEADRIFDGYLFRIVGSNDKPYWDAPSYLHQPRRLSSTDPQWYDVVAVKPIESHSYSRDNLMPEPPKLDKMTEDSMKQLSKLKNFTPPSFKPQVLTANSVSAPAPNSSLTTTTQSTPSESRSSRSMPTLRTQPQQESETSLVGKNKGSRRG